MERQSVKLSSRYKNVNKTLMFYNFGSGFLTVISCLATKTNVSFIKNLTKPSSVLPLRLVRFSMNKTLCFLLACSWHSTALEILMSDTKAFYSLGSLISN